MTDTPARTGGAHAASGGTRSGGHGARHGAGNAGGHGFFGGIALFVRQVLDELRKVVRPTWPELVRYTAVVFVFVLMIMAVVALLDFGFHYLVKALLDSGQ